MGKSIPFTPGKIGPLTLRNRTIRAAVFENVCPGNAPSEQLFNYHTSVAAGGIGMTSIAYATVMQSGLSFEHQLWVRPDIIPGLRELTDAIHKEGATTSIQLGHCGNMLHKRICGCAPVSASSGLNLYSPTVVRGMRQSEIISMTRAYGEAVQLAHEAGMDAVEIHVEHGYLISQFLSSYTSHRRDEYGGSLENRIRFMRMCMEEVMKAAGSNMTVTIGANIRDRFRGGPEMDEYLEVARILQDQCEAHALVLNGGFMGRAPMYIIRGEMPIRMVAYYMPRGYLLIGIRMVSKYMIPPEPFKEAYFLEDALEFHRALRLPLIYVGGLASRDKIEEVLGDGFEFVAMVRALVSEPGFVNHMKGDEHIRCDCGHSNYCITRIYSEDMARHKNVRGPPGCIVREIRRLECK